MTHLSPTMCETSIVMPLPSPGRLDGEGRQHDSFVLMYHMTMKKFLVFILNSYLSKHAFKADAGRLIIQAGTRGVIEENMYLRHRYIYWPAKRTCNNIPTTILHGNKGRVITWSNGGNNRFWESFWSVTLSSSVNREFPSAGPTGNFYRRLL